MVVGSGGVNMTCPNIFDFQGTRWTLDVVQAEPVTLIILLSPMRQSGCDWVSSSSLAVCWMLAVPPVAAMQTNIWYWVVT